MAIFEFNNCPSGQIGCYIDWCKIDGTALYTLSDSERPAEKDATTVHFARAFRQRRIVPSPWRWIVGSGPSAHYHNWRSQEIRCETKLRCSAAVCHAAEASGTSASPTDEHLTARDTLSTYGGDNKIQTKIRKSVKTGNLI